jgi:hypothetical protein
METEQKLHDFLELKYGGEIIFATGERIFLQGEDEESLRHEIEECETAQQVHDILVEYEVLIEE